MTKSIAVMLLGQSESLKGEKNSNMRLRFVAGHPRNNVMLEDSFLRVEFNDGNEWITLYSDANWETKYGHVN